MVYLPAALKSIAIAGIFSVGLAPVSLAAPYASVEVAQADAEDPLDADIVTVASSVDDFSTLVQALEAAELVDDLQGEGPFTVFAPTNEAFDDLDTLLTSEYGIGVADLLEPENQELLQEVLTYHVVPGAAVPSSDIPNGTTVINTINGAPLEINRVDNDVVVNATDITAYDIPASNGVIHVIDDVLLPPDVIAALEEAPVEDMEMEAEEPMEEVEEPMEEVEEPMEEVEEPMEEMEAPAEMEAPTETETQSTEPVRGLW